MIYELLFLLIDYLSTDLPPRPKYIKLRYIINFQKGMTLFYCFFLMYIFNNYTTSAYVYTSLHGSYGIIWRIKDSIMPDKSWERKATLTSAMLTFCTVLLPYWFIPFYMFKDKLESSNFKLFSCISMHTIGCVLMMASDSQKYFTLLIKKGLIDNGWFKYVRNTNYLGEMMIYLSYAILSKTYISYFILSYIWLFLFITNINIKDISISRKIGGNEYIKKSYKLIPFIF